MSRLTAKARGKRHPLNMRTTKELRDQVARAAKSSGRSMTHEVEHRLELSFLGQPDMVAAMNRLAAAIEESNRPKLGSGSLGSFGQQLVGINPYYQNMLAAVGQNGKING